MTRVVRVAVFGATYSGRSSLVGWLLGVVAKNKDAKYSPASAQSLIGRVRARLKNRFSDHRSHWVGCIELNTWYPCLGKDASLCVSVVIPSPENPSRAGWEEWRFQDFDVSVFVVDSQRAFAERNRSFWELGVAATGRDMADIVVFNKLGLPDSFGSAELRGTYHSHRSEYVDFPYLAHPIDSSLLVEPVNSLMRSIDRVAASGRF